MVIEQCGNTFISKPKKFFLIDGIGALTSAFLLGVVLVQFETVFGIPIKVLKILATLPILFALFDIYGFCSSSRKTPQLLSVLGYVNLIYCALSLGLAFLHIETITIFGWL